jgi:hypothetical protein
MIEDAQATETQSETKIPNEFPTLSWGPVNTGILSVIIGICAWLLKARVRFSKGSLEIKRDDTEGNLLDTLMEQRQALIEERDKALEDAREAWATRASDAARIGQLTSEVKYLREELARIQTEFTRLRRYLAAKGPDGIRDLFASDLGAGLKEPPQPEEGNFS